MTDLKICKRIAEIEGIEFFSVESTNQLGKKEWLYSYNPLTDDGLCFQLMVKYKVVVMPSILSESYSARIASLSRNRASIHNDNPNKAICLAIIEAHNG